MSFELPREGYVMVLSVFTQTSVRPLAPAGTMDASATLITEPGKHRLSYRPVPLFLASNAERGAMAVNRSSVADIDSHDSPYPRHEFALVIVMTKPLALLSLQAALGDVELRGPEDEVLARIAQAVGTGSGGTWSASATRLRTLNPL